MNQTEVLSEIQKLQEDIMEKKQRLAEMMRNVAPKKVKNYVFKSFRQGDVSLLDLFEEKDELIVVHNMGKSCMYCTTWADGLNGLYHHIRRKAAFVVSTPDSTEVQENVAAERSWVFPMVSTKDTTFKEDTGFAKDNLYYPGVSIFSKDKEGNIYKHADAPFGPGDDFCAVWPLFDMLPSGYSNYKPHKKINDRSAFQLTNNIAVQVSDYEKAVDFYEKTFGMQKIKNKENETQFIINGVNFFIEDSASSKGKVFFEFAVEDIKEAMHDLMEKGCTMTKEYNEKSVMMKDPYGLHFHLFEM
ncbi:Glyoxalase-like domain protein [Bacillus sp. THAF10]|uniref:DUF899 family protein n=1 Tax=Bacillus sp. THAF10 TaxID=2587848 RepID=UPI001267E534|nr:DUF899 family protein [Bacillus sp. THAF10]QFT89138.1 Glyoxalase-like domain protein [Bacillus sp. THAF10]